MHPTTPKQFNIARVSAQNDDKEFKELLHSKMYKQYNLMLSAKQSTYGQNSRVDYFVQKISPINYKDANSCMLSQLKSYSARPDLMID